VDRLENKSARLERKIGQLSIENQSLLGKWVELEIHKSEKP
jgi:hypothetical protein